MNKIECPYTATHTYIYSHLICNKITQYCNAEKMVISINHARALGYLYGRQWNSSFTLCRYKNYVQELPGPAAMPKRGCPSGTRPGCSSRSAGLEGAGPRRVRGALPRETFETRQRLSHGAQPAWPMCGREAVLWVTYRSPRSQVSWEPRGPRVGRC